VELDARAVDHVGLAAAIAALDALPGEPGYFTETFCVAARYLHPNNGERVDAIRRALALDWADSPLLPVLLTSLVEAADRVDSTTGLQMAYLKDWAARAHQPLALRVPELLEGGGRAVLGDAVEEAGRL